MLRIKSVLLMLGTVVLLAGVSSATTTGICVGDKMWFDGWHEGLQGGPVTVHAAAPSTFQDFNTFCLDPEGIMWVNGGPDYVYEVTALALPLDSPVSHTAWLYSAYLSDSLPGYVSDDRHNNALQYGLWSSIGWTDTQLQTWGYFSQQAKDDYLTTYDWTQTPDSWTGSNSVDVAYLMYLKAPSEDAQDIIVMAAIPPPGPHEVVPEPLTVVSIFLAVSGLGVYLRRRTRVSQE